MELEERVSFASSESEFIHNFGVNKGFGMTISKISRCFFLSSGAKALYYNIRDYAYGGKRESFPGQSTLRAELDWSKQTLTDYLDELRTAGLIRTEHKSHKTLTYYIEELQKVPVLAHSEIVHTIRKYSRREPFFVALKAYKKSALFQTVSQSPNPIEYKEQINDWFRQQIEGGEPQKPVAQTTPANLPKTFKVDNSVQAVANPETKEKGKKKSRDPYETAVEEWNYHHFTDYFVREYETKFQQMYMITKSDMGALSRLLKAKGESFDKAVMKTHIDNFLVLDHFETKTLRIFTSTHTQAVLDAYLNTGKVPSYRASRDEKPKHETPSDWDDQLKGIFG